MKTAQISKASLSYVDEGSGFPVLLVHGFPLDHSMWDAQIAALAATCRVIAPDLRGFGRSTLAEGDAERGIMMEDYAVDLVELLDQLAVREPVVFVGLSMGGYIGWQFLRKHGGRVRALVACDTRAIADNDEARAGRIKTAESVAETGSGKIADSMEPKLFAPATLKERPEIVAATRRVMESTPPVGIAAALRGMAARPDVTSLLPTIQVPTLVLVGEHDAISPTAEMKTIAEAIPGAEYVKIPRAGHMTTVEEPVAVNEALARFIGACRQ
jgi:3-oxoadipate enol-lactonase